ncbi:MAG TPA: hypothetical protein VG097_08610, partial [Gemmata sp.]|nr:hypothetical protein [Gemmata sp.]
MFDPNVWPGGCPPTDALLTDGLKVYRIVKNNPPHERDFLSYHQLGQPVRGGKAQQCKSHSI